MVLLKVIIFLLSLGGLPMIKRCWSLEISFALLEDLLDSVYFLIFRDRSSSSNDCLFCLKSSHLRWCCRSVLHPLSKSLFDKWLLSQSLFFIYWLDIIVDDSRLNNTCSCERRLTDDWFVRRKIDRSGRALIWTLFLWWVLFLGSSELNQLSWSFVYLMKIILISSPDHPFFHEKNSLISWFRDSLHTNLSILSSIWTIS